MLFRFPVRQLLPGRRPAGRRLKFSSRGEMAGRGRGVSPVPTRGRTARVGHTGTRGSGGRSGGGSGSGGSGGGGGSRGGGYRVAARAGALAGHDDDHEDGYRPDLSFLRLSEDGDDSSSEDAPDVDAAEDDDLDDDQPMDAAEGSHVRGEGRSRARIVLDVHGDDLFDPVTGKWLVPRLASQLTLAMKTRLKVGDVWPSWKHIPADAKENMLKEWMKRFDFTEQDKINARREFYKNGSDHMRSIMHKARDAALKKCKSTSIAQCIDTGRPTWLSERVWGSLITDHWLKDGFVVKSAKGRANRLALVNGTPSKHHAGSVSFVVTGKRMSKEKERDVQFSEVFEKTHDMSPVGSAYGGAMGAYKNAMKEKYGEDVTAWPYNDNDVYIQTMGPPKKGRFIGLGGSTSLVPLASQTGSSSYHSSGTYDLSSHDDELQSLRAQVQSLQSSVADQFKEFETRLDERDKILEEKLDSREDRMMRAINAAFDRRLGPPRQD